MQHHMYIYIYRYMNPSVYIYIYMYIILHDRFSVICTQGSLVLHGGSTVGLRASVSLG